MTLPTNPLNHEKYRDSLSKSHLGLHHTEKTRRKMSELRKGKKHSEEWNKKNSESNKGRKFTEEHRKHLSESKKGKPKPKPTEETCKKMSESQKQLCKEHPERYRLQNNPMWKGGISFEPYCPKFNNEFKERVRKFFNYTCQICNKFGNNIHHVNYDKMVCCNDVKPLFINLCRSCHQKTNHNRECWEEFFTNKIILEYDGKCYLS